MKNLLLALISIFIVANLLVPIDIIPVYHESLDQLFLSLGLDR